MAIVSEMPKVCICMYVYVSKFESKYLCIHVCMHVSK